MSAGDPDITFEESLRQSCFCPRLKGRTKAAVLEELVDALVQTGALTDRDGVLAAICSREEQMSTGMQHGVALPHGKHASTPVLVTAIGLSARGVDFGSLDGEPSRIFVMTVSSPAMVGSHFRFLALIGKRLDRPSVREAVLKSADKPALIRALAC